MTGTVGRPDADALLEAAPVALLQVADDGTLVLCNAAARALCGAGARPGGTLGGLFNGSATAAELCAPGPARQRLTLACQPEAWIELRAQSLDGGGWMVSLRPTRTPASASLADTQSALALAADLGGIALWRHDLGTGRVAYSAQAEAVLGVRTAPEGMSLQEARSVIHPDDLPRVEAAAEQALLGSESIDLEARYRRKDGGWRTVLTRRVLQRDAFGHPLAFIGVALDISARLQQQRLAEEVQRRFELATDAAGIGYWALDRGTRSPVWNASMRAILALPAGAPVPGLADWLRQWVHPDDRIQAGLRYRSWLRSGRLSLDLPLRVLRPDGSVRYLSTHTRLEAGQGRRVMFGVVIDLTEMRSAEQALHTAEQSVALAARGAGLGTWQLELDTGRAFWDAQMWLLRGRPPEPRAMSDEERMQCVHPDDRHALHQQLQEALDQGQAFENEFRIVWPDGQVRWLASRSVETRDATTGKRRRIGVNWDVTDKRNAEAERRERELAQRESQAKSRFLARMSHELRTPLNAVLGFSQLLLATEDGQDAASASRLRQLEHIRAAGAHLLALINDVLDLSSLESGELRIELQPVALAPLLGQTLPMVESLRERRAVSVALGALEGAVMADPTRLRQALLNLLSNAIKYNREGGSVLVDARTQDGTTVLRVSDSGRGMDATQLRHLFEPFNRLGRRSDGPDGVEGSGIGLTIVKAVIERMGGRIFVQSTPGIGSVFELHLAAAAPGPVPRVAPAPARLAAPAAAPRGVLLYIEDNPVNALIVSELVARRPELSLHVADTGEAGVAKALALQPDLVLLDMQLPDIDGHEVLRRLRASPALAGMPVIALSANAMPEDIELALRSGVSDYWTKPLDFAAFMASLESLFGPPA